MSIEVYFIFLALGIPTFFVWRWLLKKKISDNLKLRITTWTATIITTPLIYISILIIWIFCIEYYPSNDFDREKWFSEKEKRYKLSENIIDSKMLIGKTKTEVKQILGDEENANDSNLWNYYLGFKPTFFGIDPDALSIQFQNGKVVKVSQYQQ